MRPLARFLIILVMATTFSLCYVGLQSTLLSLSYKINRNKQTIESLLDQNNNLMYNSCTLKSPSNLEKSLASKNIFLCMPEKRQIVYLAKEEMPREGLKTASRGILNIFRLSEKAEAEPVK